MTAKTGLTDGRHFNGDCIAKREVNYPNPRGFADARNQQENASRPERQSKSVWWARSSRNSWARSNRYTRARSSELANHQGIAGYPAAGRGSIAGRAGSTRRSAGGDEKAFRADREANRKARRLATIRRQFTGAPRGAAEITLRSALPLLQEGR